MAYEIREYLDANSESPYRRWLNRLDAKIKARVLARIFRFELGNLGDAKSVGDGVWEARLMFGPGYRIYFGRDGSTLIILLLGGDKGSQGRDITKAKGYWQDYRSAGHVKAK